LVPTGETALFIVAGEDMEKRLQCHSIFKTEHLFYKQSVIELGETRKGESVHHGILSMTLTFRDLFMYNSYSRPRFSADFPAHLLTTQLEWEDLMLMPVTKSRLDEVKAYLRHYDTLLQRPKMRKHIKPGCRILFYGDSGTGKTLAASLLGKHLGKDVYRVDISAVTSKYVGETTKRLDSLFNTAESKGWIIFIDEGDALLGQRKSTDTGSNNSSHYVNQDVAFLLQRIETYDGIVIVATNFKNNIDQAFTRRFQGMVRFQLPDTSLQYQLWQENLSPENPLDPSIDLMTLIQKHPLSPAAIMNVIFRASVLTLDKKTVNISAEDLLMCIKDEEVKYLGRQAMGM
jgi:SpoVK/Ycf46/Vps4 family AAA+-type ATPase